VLALLHGASPMILGKFKMLLIAIVAAGVLAGVAGFAGAGREKPAAETKDEAKPPAAAKPAEAPRPAEGSKELKYQGVVLDGAGKPIAGAIVRHKNKEVARSDERGRFEYAAAPASREFGDVNPVVVTAEGHAPDWNTLGNDPQLVFRLPAPMTVRGRLV